jgi:hypothetical protein
LADTSQREIWRKEMFRFKLIHVFYFSPLFAYMTLSRLRSLN